MIPHFQTIADNHPRYDDVRHFLRDTYTEHYGSSDIPVSGSFIVYCHPTSSEVFACAMIHYASDGRLPSEVYIPQPIDKLVRRDRKQYAEVGRFAAAGGCGAGWTSLRHIFLRLYSESISHAVTTVTSRMARYLRKREVCLQIVAKALVNSLPARERRLWGSYYDDDPHVVLIDLKESVGSPATRRRLKPDPKRVMPHTVAEVAVILGKAEWTVQQFAGSTIWLVVVDCRPLAYRALKRSPACFQMQSASAIERRIRRGDLNDNQQTELWDCLSPQLQDVLTDWLNSHPGGSHTFCQQLDVPRSRKRRDDFLPITDAAKEATITTSVK